MSSRARCRSPGVAGHLPAGDVGQPPLQAPHRFLGGFAGGEFAPVAGAAFGVVAPRDDGHDVQDLVDPAVAGPGQAVPVLVTAGGSQGCGAVPGREPALVGEPRDVTDVAEEARRAGGADAVQGEQAAAGRGHQLFELSAGGLDAPAGPRQLGDQLGGEPAAGLAGALLRWSIAEGGDWCSDVVGLVLVLGLCWLPVPWEVISVAVRWYLRYGLSYRDVGELLAERGVTVDHVTIYRWVQRFTLDFIEAARPCRHAPGDRWFADETYLKVAGKRAYLYQAAGQHGQVIDVLLSVRRDLAAARRIFTRALQTGTIPAEVTTDRAPAYPRVLDELIPQRCTLSRSTRTIRSRQITGGSKPGSDRCAD